MWSKEKKTISGIGGRSVGRFIVPLIYILLGVVLMLVPTGFQKAIYYNAEGAVALVLDTDNSTLYNNGYFRVGEERLEVRILTGSHKGLESDAVNMLSGSLDNDKLFSPGDKAWVSIERDGDNNPLFINAVDYWRGGRELVLVALFVLVLLLFSSTKGGGIVLSFALTFLFIWKVLIPFSLKGFNPVILSFLSLLVLTITTITLILGVNKKALSAILGAISSDILVALLSLVSTSFLLLDGFNLSGSESLLYSGFGNLDFKLIFSSVVMLSSGGAVMDLAVDVVSAMDEVYINNPIVERKDLFMSGIRVGRAGIGTQTSTLLLAYLSSYLVPFMVYMAQSTPIMNILVSKEIASAMAETVVGCTGLVLASPLSALMAGIFFYKKGSSSSRGV